MNVLNGFATGIKAADSRVSSLISTAWNAAPHIVRAPLSAVAGVALSAIAKVGAGFDYVGIPATSLVTTHKVAILTGFKVVGAIAATYALVKIAQVCFKLASQGLTAAGKGLTSAREAIQTRIYKEKDLEIAEKDQEIANLKMERDAATTQLNAATNALELDGDDTAKLNAVREALRPGEEHLI